MSDKQTSAKTMKVVCQTCGHEHMRVPWVMDPMDAVLHRVAHCEKCKPDELHCIPNDHLDKNGKFTELTKGEWEHIRDQNKELH